MERHNARSHAGRYLIALIAPAVVAVVMLLAWPFFEQSTGAPFMLAVMISALSGGFCPGMCSSPFWRPDYFFIQPYCALWPSRHGNLVFLVTHITIWAFINVLSELMHRAKRHAESSLEWIASSFAAASGATEIPVMASSSFPLPYVKTRRSCRTYDRQSPSVEGLTVELRISVMALGCAEG